ncbi:MAG: hypothetical protein AB7T49_13560 [Oligoflexales bacterium]
MTRFWATLICFCLSSPHLLAAGNSVGSVERDLQSLLQRITALHTKTRATEASLSPKFDSNSSFEQQYVSEAKNAYESGKYAYVVYLLERIHLVNPVPESAASKDTLWLLANANHQIGRRAKAVYYFTKYFSTLQQFGGKADGHDKTLEILSSYVDAPIEIDPKSIEALLTLLVESSDVPAVKGAALHLLAKLYRTQFHAPAKSAKIAQSAIELGISDDLLAKVYLERAWTNEKRESDLEACLKHAKLQDIRGHCLIESARLQKGRGKRERAVGYYSDVAPDSIWHQQALFEKIYVNFDLGRTDDTLKDIDAYLAKYPSDYRAADLRSVKIYLALSKRDLKVAQDEINRSKSDLDAIRNNLKSMRSSIVPVEKRLDSYLNLHGYDLSRFDEFRGYRSLFDILIKQKQRALDLKAAIWTSVLATENDLLYTGNPNLGHKEKALQGIIDEGIRAGQDLVEMRKGLYFDEFSEDDKRQWEYLEEKQERISTAAHKVSSQNKSASSLTQLFRQRAVLHAGYERLKILQARVSGAMLQAKTANNTQLVRDLAKLSKRSTSLESSLSKGIGIVRGRKIERYVDFSKSQYARSVLLDNSEIIKEKMEILDTYSKNVQSPSDRVLVEAMDNAWTAWSAMATTMEKAAIAYDGDLRDFYLTYLERMDDWLKATERNLGRTEQFIGQIDRGSINTLNVGIGDDLETLDDREELLKKWQVDIQLLSTMDKQAAEEAQISKSAIEAKIMSQALRDLEKGIY